MPNIPTSLHNAIFDTDFKLQREREYVAEILIQQIISGVHYLHCNCCIHRDLKPGNILVSTEKLTSSTKIKIIDFGLASLSVKGRANTLNVVTTGYRPPEIFFLYPFYTHTVDIWSVGVIYAELINPTKNHLFTLSESMSPNEIVTQFEQVTGRHSIYTALNDFKRLYTADQEKLVVYPIREHYLRQLVSDRCWKTLCNLLDPNFHSRSFFDTSNNQAEMSSEKVIPVFPSKKNSLFTS